MRLHQTPFALALLTALAACATAPPPPTDRDATRATPEPPPPAEAPAAPAATLADERPVEDFEADQLIEIADVTDEIRTAVDAVTGAQARSALRDSLTEAVGERIQEERGGEEAGIEVEVVSLYNGGLYSAYVFRRCARARLVMVPELQLGYFGGDPDNFTYPRYSLDFAFFRLYDDNDQPLRTDDHFRWSETGSSAGDLVFIIGNPGSTSRLQTVSELEFRRDVEMPALLGFLGSRIEAIEDYIEGREDEPGIDQVRDPALAEAYQPLFDQMAELQSRKAAMDAEFNAFTAFGNSDYESSLILRTLATFQYLGAQQQGASPEEIEGIIDELKGVTNRPRELDEALLAARYRDMVQAFGAADPSVRALLGGRSVEQVVTALMNTSAMADSAGAVDIVAGGMLNPAAEPAFAFVQALLGRFGPYQAVMSTTYYGLYDRHYSNPGTDEWALPERWLNPSSDFDLSTPLNFVSTADIIGGNSGSPVVNRDLEIVGLVFDGNIQSLPGDYIYIPALNRSIAVDARGILEALEDIYGAARIVEELTSGRNR